MKKKIEKEYHEHCLNLLDDRIAFVEEKLKNDPKLSQLYFYFGEIYYHKKRINITNKLNSVCVLPFEPSMRIIFDGVLADISHIGVRINIEDAKDYLFKSRQELLEKINGSLTKNSFKYSSNIKPAVPCKEIKSSIKKTKRLNPQEKVRAFIKVALKSLSGKPLLKDLANEISSKTTWSNTLRKPEILYLLSKELTKKNNYSKSNQEKIENIKVHVSYLLSNALINSSKNTAEKEESMSTDAMDNISIEQATDNA